jgi:hypothetical protein
MRDSLGGDAMIDRIRRLLTAPVLSEPGAALLRHWREHDVPLNGPASVISLWRVRRKIGGALPTDFVGLYRRANGMHRYASDDLMVNMWSAERIIHQRFRYAPFRGHTAELCVFADVASEIYFFSLDRSGFVSICGDAMVRPIGTFAEFLYLYWADPRSLGLNDRVVAA